MPETLKVTPMLYAALGAAVSYYGVYAGRGWLVLPGFILVILISFTSALTQGPVCFFHDPKVLRRFRQYKVYIIALSLGFTLGFGAGLSKPIRLGLPEAAVTGIYGILQDDPVSLTQGRGMGNLVVQRVSGIGGIRASAAGKMRVFFPDGTVPRLKEFGRGSAVYIEGVPIFSKESAGKIQGFRAQSVHIVHPAPVLEQFRTSLRLNLVKRFTEPAWGGLALALLLGVRENLDMELSKSYQDAGCSHILALSGMHLALVTAVIAFLLKKPLGLKPAGIIGMACIIIYVYLVGNLPSLNRAAIMYILGTLAVLGALPKQTASLLGMAFLIQLGIQPESGQSISFILSYLALGGILFIGEIIHDLIRGIIPEILAQPLAVSLGAFIATAAVVALFFGIVRPIGIPAGLIIVPLTTLFMMGAMIALALDIFFPCLFPFFGLILSVLYDILKWLAVLGAQAPGLAVFGPVPVLFISLGLAVVCLLLWYRQQRLRRSLAPFD